MHCSSCDEPWDAYHLRHEAIFETDLSQEEATAWCDCSPEVRLLPRYREKLHAAGWQFGASILDVVRCPCCPLGANPDPDKAAMKAAIVELLGDDEDGLAAEFENLRL